MAALNCHGCFELSWQCDERASSLSSERKNGDADGFRATVINLRLPFQQPCPATMLNVARLVLASLLITAVCRQLLIHIQAAFSVVNFFSYFTNLSNIIAALVLLLSVFARTSRSVESARYVSTVNMTLVGIVFAVLLRNVDLGALVPWINFVLHYVMPVAIVLDWVIDPPINKLTVKHMLIALVVPSCYLAYVVLRGASVGWYPYPFLNPIHVGGAQVVALYALAIAVTVLVLSGVLILVGNGLRGARPSKEPE